MGFEPTSLLPEVSATLQPTISSGWLSQETVVILSVIMLNVIMLNVIHCAECHECDNADCHYAECH
jgi:hypothetical protein